MPLPDVPQAEYDTYLADQFTERTNRRIDDLQGSGNFLASSSRRIASLGVEPIEVASATSPLIGQAPVFVPPQRLPPIPTMPQMPGQAPPQPAPTPSPMPPPAPPLPPMGGPNMAGPAPSLVQEPPAQQVPLPGPSRPAGEPVPITPLTPLVPGPFAQPQPPRPQAAPTAPPPAPTPAPFAQDGSYQSYARQAADRAGIDPSVFVAQIQQESGFNPNAGSPAGALGIAQIVPRYHPGVDPKDPYASLDYAAGLMSRLLRQYNGDWTKALVAYNGGGGAVAAWDRGEPYAESQTYVAKILGDQRPTAAAPPTVAAPTTARAVPTAMAQSQFGDRELTASEAYAACGPAAAVRFAQAYGRNPTLREATDLAATVGWTPESGMAGIASEQRLMQKLGLDTRLVGGPQWNQFAAEAQSGNPITISTPGHYFYADGYNPSSGAFHVGQSGLDLRGGKEWMTPSDMERLMGAAQGALFANNPTVPDSSSVTAGTTRELDDVRRQISSSFGAAPVPPVVQRSPIESADPQVRRLDQAVEMAYLPPQARRAPEPATVPLAMAGGVPPPGPPGGGPFDQIGRAISDAIQGALRNLGGGPGGPGGGGGGRDEDRYGNRRVATPEPGTFDASAPITDYPIGETTAERTRREIERFRHLGGNPNLPELPLADIGVPDLTPPRNALEAFQRAQADALRRGLPSPGPTGQLGILDPKLGNPFGTEEANIGEGVVRGLGGELSRAGEGAAARTGRAVTEAVESGGRPTTAYPGIVDPSGEFRLGVPRVNQDRADYLAERGIANPPRVYVDNDVPLQQSIADYYERTPSTPNDPSVRAAYDAFNREAHDQYQFLTERGVKFEPYGDNVPNPYRSSAEMRRDVEENNHLWVYTGGDPHPMMNSQQNWEFRAVHDYFGHANSGVAFGPRGEENAWLEHMSMFGPEAQKAMTTETRGQNSWVNFGPYGEANRAAPTKTTFAEQKALLLPDALRNPARPPAGETTFAPHGMAVPRPGYAEGTPEATVENLFRQRAREQGTRFPDVSGDEIRRFPGMAGAALKNLDEVRNVIRAGLAGARWYSQIVQQIRRDTGLTINPREAAVLMGRFGGNAGVQANYHAMLSVFDAMRQVLPDLRGFEEMAPKEIMATDAFKAVAARVHGDKAYVKDLELAGLMRAYRTGEVEIPSNAKLSSYTQNFLHSLSDRYDPYSTQDVWQGRLFGARDVARRARPSPKDYAAMLEDLTSRMGDQAGKAAARERWAKMQREADRFGLVNQIRGPDVAASDPAYRAMHAMTNWVARELDVSPREAQAAGWAVTRTLFESPEYGAALRSGRMSLNNALLIERARGGNLLGEALADTTGEVVQGGDPTWLGKIDAVRGRIQANGSYDAPPHPSWTAASEMQLHYPGGGMGTRVADVTRPVGRTEAEGLRGLAAADQPVLQVPGRVEVDESGRIPWLAPEHTVQQVGDRTYVSVMGVGDDAAHLIGQRLGATSFNHASPEVPFVGGLHIDDVADHAQRQALIRDLSARGLAAIDTGSGVRVPLYNDSDLSALGTTIRDAVGDHANVSIYQGVTHDVRGATEDLGGLRVQAGETGPSGVPARDRLRSAFESRDLPARLFRDAGPAGPAGATDATAGARAALADPDVGAAVADVLGGAQSAFGTPNFAVHVAGAASGGFLANLYTDENDPNRAAKIAAGVASGYAGGRIATTIATRGSAAAGRGLSRSAPEKAWDWWVRGYADKNVDLNHVQQDFKRITGKPWTDAMSVAYLARVDPSNRALVATQNAVGQAIQRVQRAGNYDTLSKWVSLESDIATAEGLGTRAERDFLRGGISENTTRRMADARKDLDAAQLDYARALADQRAAASGVRPTRDSTRMAASEQRVRDAKQTLDDATDAAREAQAAQAAESMYQSPAGILVRRPETRDLLIAESDVARLTRRYEGMHDRNPENRKLRSVARQLGYAEDRLSRIRQHLGEVMPERESAVAGRAEAAADQARNRPRVSPTPELAAARVRLRYEQRNLERLQAEQARGQQGLDEALARAHRSFLEAERDVNVATADLPAAARAQGFAQKTGRIFEGGQRYDDLVAERDALERSFAAKPEQWAQVRKAADDLFDYRKVLLEEMVDSRLITRDEASNLVDLYPKWTPTRMIDYMYAAGEGGGMRRGDKISVSSNGLRRYTEEGYAGERENRIASLFREAWDVYARGAQNRSFNAFVDYVEEARPSNMKRIARDMDEWAAHGGTGGDLLNPNYRPKVGRGEETITGMRDGVKQEWVTDDPYLKAAVEMAPDSPLSGIMGKAWQGASRLTTETATSRNPKWLAKNVMRDAGTYLIGTMAEGGVRGNILPLASTYGPAMATYLSTDPNDPNRLQKALAAGAAGYLARSAPGINRAFGPNLLGEMLAGYADAFSGITSGTFTGRGTQEYLLRGGGMRGGTLSRAGIEGGERLAGMIRNPGGIRISNMNDLSRLLKDAALGGWVKAIGSRLELGPRVAGMRVAEARGASPLEAMIAGRDVTLDFDRGGLWTKEVNRYIPFMNAAAQGGLRFTRLARDHPGGMFLAGSALVGGPTLAAMQWNRGDATRSADYDDVQDYIKARGPVLMLPWVGTDKDGNRQPLHLDFDMAQFAPFAVAAQEAYDRAQGKQGRGAGQLASSLGGAIVPGGASNPVDAATQILPVPFSTAAQLGLNRDFYRGSTIANRFSDERATALAQAAAPAIEAGVTRIPGLETARIRPSQVDFAVRDILGGAGQTATEAGNVGRPPRVPGAPSETPVVGGLASGFLRTGGGQQFENVRQPTQMMANDIRQRLRRLGGMTQYYEPSVVPEEIQKIPLRQAEQTEYQRLTNQYFDEYLRRTMTRSVFETSDIARKAIIDKSMEAARKKAAAEVLRGVRARGSNLGARVRAASSAP